MKPQNRPATNRQRRVGQRLLGATLALLSTTWLLACGPDFPNWLLGEGDSILAAPFASFQAEIARLKLPAPRHTAWLTTNDYPQQALDAELSDLRAALAQAGRSPTEIEAVAKAHEIERRKLTAFTAAMDDWREKSVANLAPPAFPGEMAVSGLPAEFADYLRGSIAWHRGDTNAARVAWTTLLARPQEQRKYKSTWAAYMLGRSWEDEDPGKAIRLYQQVSTLADAGFADSDGLAVASLGREARLSYLAGEHQRAIKLYLQQQAAGVDATVSLRWVAAAALHAGPPALNPLARDPIARRVITAYIISGGFRDAETDIDGPLGELFARTMEKTKVVSAPAGGWHKRKAPVLLWLEAIESAGVRDAQEAERFSLACYQAGQFDQAARWLDRAPLTSATRWLRAKLLLREGKVNEAAALLASAVRELAAQPETDDGISQSLAANLTFSYSSGSRSAGYVVASGRQLVGELGALRLVRREYAEALDALLRSGFWMDAAYVAERVLTVEELKMYVERNWPEPPPATNNVLAPDRVQASEIRYLLARRLLRLNRFEEARPLFPSELHPKLDELHTNQVVGADLQRSKESRAAALWTAAQILRVDGMDLIGAELEPDWHIYGSSYRVGVTLKSRTNSVPLRASADEIGRARQNGVEPEARFHNRYVAANVAWEATKLMPDNSDETAKVLCLAGSWIKYLDPKAADVFYKALVRRCRKTAIGAEADRKRWFPILDPDGNLRTKESPDAKAGAEDDRE